MAEDSDLERTEQPSSRRLEQAREQGQVPHSRELGTFLVLLVSAVMFWGMGGWFVERSLRLMHKGLQIDAAQLRDADQALLRLTDLSQDALLAFSPLLAAVLVAAVLPPVLMNGLVFAPNTLMPNFGRMDPLTGIGRMFSWNSLVELLKAVLKSTLVGGMGFWVIWREKEEILGLLAEPINAGLVHAGHILTFSFLAIVAVMILIVAADVPFQLWQHFDKLKMSKEEVRRENKEMEGDPMVKGRIRSMQREAARKRMMAAVPKADVIVTNPTHYAVALSYTMGMRAPKVIAKGMGEIALRIREIGAEHRVPLLEAPPLARALYRHAELDSEIPADLYNAVAEVLAYVYQLDQWRQQGGDYPLPPRNLPVPAELVPEAA
ncbi:MAG: hypothetical protein RIR00_2590 [Pseudomonadota bacterium]|jgi:flagellar biosynthetic protein FlhB